MRADLKPEYWRVAESGGTVAGVARFIPFAHYWGGRAVPAAGVASVVIAAEARGRGVGTTLMRELLTDLRGSGFAISSLYPATVPIYRQCGYGYGAIRSRWKADLGLLPQTTERDVTVEAFDDGSIEELNAAYEGIAATTNGLVARDRDWWAKRVLTAPWDDKTRYRYLVREAGAITGWIIYVYGDSKEWQFTLECRDLFWTTPRAARALLSLAALHRSTAKEMTWVGPVNEPLIDLTPDHAIDHDGSFRTMVRLLDVPAAFEARGYPESVDASVTIAVRDAMFPANAGPWRIQVSGGSAKVVPSSAAADAMADVQMWASLWTGLHGAHDAVRAGGLEATPAAIDALDAMFAGQTPWIADFY